MRHPSWRQLAFGLGLALALASAGQVALQNKVEWAGLAGYLAAGVLFTATLRVVEAGPIPATPDAASLRRHALVILLWLAAAGLLSFAVLRVNQPALSPEQDRLTLIAWLLAVACFIAGALRIAGDEGGKRPALRVWAVAHGRELASVGILVALALALRLVGVESHPYPFSGDEASVGSAGRMILSGRLTNYFETAWSSQPVWSFLPTALSVGVFGSTIFSVRLVGAIAGALTVAALYLFARETFGRGVAMLASAFVVAFPHHLQFSRLGVNNVMDALLASGVLWLTFRAVRRGHPRDYLWIGLAAGATLYTYLGSRLVLALAVGTLGYTALYDRPTLWARKRHLALFGLGAVVVAAPMAAFFIQHPDIFMARINQEGILQNGWLVAEAARMQRPVVAILWDQFVSSARVYVAGSAISGFFNSPRPYLTSVGAVFFVLGMAYAAVRVRVPHYLTLIVWFWSVVILGSALTVNPPTSERLVMTIPAVAVFVGLGLRHTAVGLRRLGLLPARLAAGLCAAVISIVSLQGAVFYFGEYRSGNYFADPAGELALEASREAATLGAGYQLVLLGAPRVFADFPTFGYFLPDMDRRDLEKVSAEAIGALPRDRGTLFVAIPERRAEIEDIARLAPGGVLSEFARVTKAEILYYAYTLPPQP